MNRRAFLQRAGGGAVAIPFAPVAVGAFGWREQDAPKLTDRVHVLGPVPTGTSQLGAKMLSDDVFSRLCAAVRGKSFRVTTAERVGETAISALALRGVITDQWNTSYVLDRDYLVTRPPVFPIEHFRLNTAGWIRGSVMMLNSADGVKAEEAFGGARYVGMPVLPILLWSAHYVDEATGMVMRAVADFRIQYDDVICRWDVLCG